MRMDNRGFTLIEVLAVIVILGVIALITVPTITNVISKNKDDNYENLKKSIVSSAKVYMSDNRYSIELEGSIDDSCKESSENIDVKSVKGKLLNASSLTLKMLVDSGDLKTKNGNITDPKNDKKINLEQSNIKVHYSCKTKDYVYEDISITYQ